MRINAQITLLVKQEGVIIEIRDQDAGEIFLELGLTPEQFCQALARRWRVPCESAQVQGLEKIGKRQEYRSFEFPLPVAEGMILPDRKINAMAEVRRLCPPGWQPDEYFDSQDSFFRREGQQWARTMIRRWVPIS